MNQTDLTKLKFLSSYMSDIMLTNKLEKSERPPMGLFLQQ